MSYQRTQDQEYLDLIRHRILNEYLTWVEQALYIISDSVGLSTSCLSLNDIGCQVGQFYKGFQRRHLNIDYMGYDIEPIYLQEASKFFPGIKTALLDISKQAPRIADIVVTSATLEHIKNIDRALNNILKTTRKLVIIRTSLGYNKLSDRLKKENALNHHLLNQYTFSYICGKLEKYNFKPTIIRDRYTDSFPFHISKGIVRTIYIVKGIKDDHIF